MAVGTLTIKSADASTKLIVRFENVSTSYFISTVQIIFTSKVPRKLLPSPHKNTNQNNPYKLESRAKTNAQSFMK